MTDFHHFIFFSKLISLQSEASDLELVLTSTLSLFSGFRDEELRIRAFNMACDENGTEFFHSIRGKIARAICEGNHAKLFQVVHLRLCFKAEDLQEQEDEGRYSLLWMACDQENPELVGHLLEIEGVLDVPGPDGMTAFA